MSDDVELCVVGAGPAGAALATRLAGLGHDVAIVDQHRFPRPHVGESLSPGIWPLLDTLGVSDRVADAGFTQTSIARVRWRDDNEERTEAPGGLTVDRGDFDAILLQRARESLAPVRSRPRAHDGRSAMATDGSWRSATACCARAFWRTRPADAGC